MLVCGEYVTNTTINILLAMVGDVIEDYSQVSFFNFF